MAGSRSGAGKVQGELRIFCCARRRKCSNIKKHIKRSQPERTSPGHLDNLRIKMDNDKIGYTIINLRRMRKCI